MKIVSVARTQHLLLRFHAGDTLPDTLLKQLREHQITGASLRLTGVLADVEVRAFSSEIEGPGGTKRITGPVQAVVLDGSVGVAAGGVSLDLRVVLARETDRGLETIAGELVRARVVGLDGSMTVLVDTIVPRGLDKDAGVWLLRDDAVVTAAAAAAPSPAPAQAPAPPPPAPPPPARPSVPAPAPSAPVVPPAPASWSDAVAASAAASTAATRVPTPLARAAPPADDSEDGPYPQAGDLAEHFAFGSCEILKSDGDRLHVRMKDGRIREIALEMLKVMALPAEGGRQRFRLSRRG